MARGGFSFVWWYVTAGNSRAVPLFPCSNHAIPNGEERVWKNMKNQATREVHK
jgi:hypothetical protein